MFFEKSEVTRYPIKKQPIIFTVRVPKIPEANIYLLKFVRMYLSIAPVAPPVATRIKLINIF